MGEAATMVELKSLFQEIDDARRSSSPDKLNASLLHFIDEETFYKLMSNDTVRAHFAILGIEVNHAQCLFQLLDQDQSGRISMDEFIAGCLRMRGDAKAVDMALLLFTTRRVLKKLDSMNKRFAKQSRDSILRSS